MDAGTEKNYLGWLNPNVLTDFIDDLRDAGYKIGISQYIAAHDLLLTLTAQGETLNRPERLKTLLGPIFCSSPAEQEDFQQRFDRWVEFVSQTSRATERADIKAQALSEELNKIRWRFRQLILTFIAIVLTEFFLLILFEQSIKDDSPQPKQPSATQPSATQPSATQPSATQPSATQPSATQLNPDFSLVWQKISLFLFCFLLTLCIAFIVWRLWWLWRAHLFLQRHGTTEQPELHKISIREFEQNLFSTIMFINTAQSLRHRIRIPSHELNVDTTIEATLLQGGWLTPVYSTRQVLPEYLFLINRVSYRDHQAKFMEEMVDLLRHNGVFITIYFFDNDPRICFPTDGTSTPQKLHEIKAKYTQHRLIIVLDTEKLFSTQTSELEPWVSQMKPWVSRAILTPKPVENWGSQELELARQFIVLPATPQGLRVLSQVLHQGSATYVLSKKAQFLLPEPLRVRPHYWIERNPPKPEHINIMFNSLQEYLGKDGFYWLSACAVFPELHWNITIYLGNVLKAAEGHCLLEVCSLTNLARLPWFRYGKMPDWLRSLLIATLTHEQKHTIRTTLQDLLVTAVQGSVDRLQLEIAKKYHSFLPKLADAILHLLSRRVAKGSPLRDYLFLSFMRGQPKLAVKVPDTFDPLLQQRRKKLFLILLIVTTILSVVVVYLFQQKLGDYTRAINDDALAIKLNLKDVYYSRGLAYYDKKDYDSAIKDYNQALIIDPKYAYAYYSRGVAYYNKKDYDSAIKDYNQAIMIDPIYADAYNNRGLAYYNKKDYDSAIKDYNQAIMIDPIYANAYYNRGLAYYNKKDYDSAIKDYNQALIIDPKYAYAYNNRGLAYYNKKDYDSAIKDYNQALIIDSKDANAYNNRGLDYFGKGRKDKAIEDFKKVLELNNNVELSQEAKQRLQELGIK